MAAPSIVSLVDRREIARATTAFSFQKPAGFSFIAGQFLRLKLPQLPDDALRSNIRSLSIASAPFEDTLVVAMRSGTSTFKQTLWALPIGTDVEIAGPYGRFVLHDDPTLPAIFLAGGIGITPMRSIILQALHEQKPHQLFLFSSNSTPPDSAFFDELERQASVHTNFHFIPTMTNVTTLDEPWTGEIELMSQAMIERYLKTDIQKARYSIAGPPTMVSAMRVMLTAAAVPSNQFMSEEFSGY